MKRLAALGALATLSMLAGCATGDGYYSGAYGYGYPAYAYDDGYYDYGYPYSYGYPYAYGPTLGLGFGYYDYGGYGGYRDGYRHRGDRFGGDRFRGGDRHFQGRPSSPQVGGLGPQAVGPQGRGPSGANVAPRQRTGGVGRPRQG